MSLTCLVWRSLLPAEYIRPAGEETTAALRYALAFIARKMHL